MTQAAAHLPGTDAAILGRAKEILAALVAFPTVSADSNLACVAYVRSLLAPLGASIEIIPDATGQKASLLATIGPPVAGGIVLSGHLDVVPAEGQVWTVPPFRLTEAEGRLHGRGTTDMKGFVACVLAAAPAFAAAPLGRPVHIALTHDEEVGCLGAPALIAALLRGPMPSACIVGEPTGLGLIDGHKGCFEYTTRITGLEGHGARPDACVNAALVASRYASALAALAEALKPRAPASSPFDPPWTTLSVGRLAAGHARNVVPASAEIDWEFRPVQPSDILFVKERLAAFVEADLLPAMRAVHPGAAIETDVVGEVAGLVPDPASPALALGRRLTGERGAGTVPFGTEAGLFQAAGIPAIVCGPGDIARAHRPDEWIGEDELSGCIALLTRLRGALAA